MGPPNTGPAVALLEEGRTSGAGFSPAFACAEIPHAGGPVRRDIPFASLRVLFLHQNPATVERCLRELRSVQVAVVGDVAHSPEQFSGRLGSQVYDVVLAEYPDCIGLAAQAQRQLQGLKQTPLIFLADHAGRNTAAEHVSNGAADCVGNLTYGLCCCDLEGRFLDADRALVAMLGYASKDDLLAASRAGLLSVDAPTREKLRGYMTGAHADPVETGWQRRDGTILQIRLTGRSVTWTEGPTPAYELIAEDLANRSASENHRRDEAATDPLTDLANYRELTQVLDGEIKRSSRTGREFAVLVFDVDRLKRINDEHGHEIGSQALCRVADCLSIFSRQIDTAARLGGDEFASRGPAGRR